MEDPAFYQLRQDKCRTDLLPLDPVDEDDDGEFEDPKDVLLVLYCDKR